jgi:hypothetical protein
VLNSQRMPATRFASGVSKWEGKTDQTMAARSTAPRGYCIFHPFQQPQNNQQLLTSRFTSSDQTVISLRIKNHKPELIPPTSVPHSQKEVGFGKNEHQ